MDLKRKLERLSFAGGPSDESGHEPTAPSESPPSSSPGAHGDLSPLSREERLRELRSRLAGLASGAALKLRREGRVAHEGGAALEGGPAAAIPGERRETSFGAVHLCEHRFAADHCHGTAPLSACLRVEALDIAALALDPSLGDLDPSRLLFFDLETTGLAGGAGTLPFLVGMAYFEGGALCVEQLFLRQPGEEGPILRYLADRCRQASCLVTYNGKAFDWPLVRTRCVLNRVTLPPIERHLDLLHCARRAFKFRLLAMRLGHLEREVLGFERHDDIDGADIPASYFAFLRRGDGSLLRRVFEHNVHDLAALAAVLGHLGGNFRDLTEGGDPRDWLGLAHVAARAGDAKRALLFALAGADKGSGALAAQALLLAAKLRGREGAHAEAAELLERALCEAPAEGELAATAHLQLAKLYEHRLGDLERALVHAGATAPCVGREAEAHRVTRLRRRLGV
jgi:uncharacterized protein